MVVMWLKLPVKNSKQIQGKRLFHHLMRRQYANKNLKTWSNSNPSLSENGKFKID